MARRTSMHRALAATATAILLGLTATACGGDGDGTSTAAAATNGDGTGDRAVITVLGHGKVQGTPDVMTISLGVMTGGPNAQEAMQDNNTRARNLVNVLKEAGVADADIQTSELSVWPTYDEKGREITGYAVSNMVTAKLRDMDGAGALIDAATFAVGNAIRMNGIAFSIDDTSELVAEARADAVKRAMAQAKQLADAAGVTLGDIVSIDETGREMPRVLEYAADEAAIRASAPIEPGSQDVTLDVRVVFEIAR
jgi:uncharacterized protein YggE